MNIEKNAEGLIKYTGSYQTVLPNGYTLSLEIGENDKTDGSFEEIEYWCTEEQLIQIHSTFGQYINDVGYPRTGDGIFDGSDYYEVKKIYFDYSYGKREIQIDLTI